MNTFVPSLISFRQALALCTLLGVLPIASSAADATPPPADTSPADTDWQNLQAIYKELKGKATPSMSRVEIFRLLDASSRHFMEASRKFMQDYPDNPHRWELVRQMFARVPRCYVEYKPGFEEEPYPMNAVIDRAERARWQAMAEGYKAEMDANPNVPRELKEQVELTALYDLLASSMHTGVPVDLGALRRRMDAAEQRFPASERIWSSEVVYYRVMESERPEELEAYLTWLAGCPDAATRQFAEGKQLLIRARATGFDLAFTSLDGRAVDLAKLHGKVVLVDFWATWCGPCVAELPNVKKVYAAYHDKGFEVVGISLDKQEDRQKLIDFLAKNEMPWPQHFDGGYWKNAIAAKYGIKAIPAMFLLDPEGRLVTTAARGPKLEAEVKRLLKL